MNTDCRFEIGADHLVCEDFAHVFHNDACKTAVAIVSDGCTSSSNTDIGARILALSAFRVWGEYISEGDEEIDANTFGKKSIFLSKSVLDQISYMNIQPGCLDATLLVAFVRENDYTVFMFGDGVFFHKSKEGIHTVNTSLTSGAPDYLSYYLNSDRKRRYDSLEENLRIIQDTRGNLDDEIEWSSLHTQIKSSLPFEYTILRGTAEPGDIIAVCSDGINTYRKPDYSPISVEEMGREFLDYKNTVGVFVKRKMNALHRRFLKEGITHSDDVSISSIIV